MLAEVIQVRDLQTYFPALRSLCRRCCDNQLYKNTTLYFAVVITLIYHTVVPTIPPPPRENETLIHCGVMLGQCRRRRANSNPTLVPHHKPSLPLGVSATLAQHYPTMNQRLVFSDVGPAVTQNWVCCLSSIFRLI